MATQMKKTALACFLSGVCDCGRPKQSHQSHCSRCYHALPKDMQKALYRRFGSGYEEAFVASLEWLRANRSTESDSFKFA